MIQNFIFYREDFLFFTIGLFWLLITYLSYSLYKNQRIRIWHIGNTDLSSFSSEEKQNYIPWNYLLLTALCCLLTKWCECYNGIFNNPVLKVVIGAGFVGSALTLYLGYRNANIIKGNNIPLRNTVGYLLILIIPLVFEKNYSNVVVWEFLVLIPIAYKIASMIKKKSEINKDKSLNCFAKAILYVFFLELIFGIFAFVFGWNLPEGQNAYSHISKVVMLSLMSICIGYASYNLWAYGKKVVTVKSLLFSGYLTPVVVILTLIVGLCFRELRIDYKSNILIDKMVNFAVKVARVVDMEDLQPHADSVEQNVKFDKINKLLLAYKNTNDDYAGLCTVWKDGEDYIFGPESYLPGEVLSSPKWSKYLLPPVSVENCFKEKRYLVDSYTDEFGHFLSVLVPLQKKNTNEVYSVIILDYVFDKYVAAITTEIIAGLVVMMFLTCFMMFCISIFYSNEQLSGSRETSIVILPAVVFAFCIGITSIFAYYVSVASFDDNTAYFEDVAKAKSEQITGLFNKLKTELLGVLSFRKYLKNKTVEEFDAILGKIQEYGNCISFESRTRVKGSDIKKFEESIRLKTNANYKVRVFDKVGGKTLEIDDDMFYWPSSYEYPKNILNSHLGDEYIEFTRRKAIRYMMATCKSVALSPKDIQNRFTGVIGQGLEVFSPYDFVDANHFNSMIVSIIELQSLLEHLMPMEYFKAEKVCFEIFEVDDNEDRERQLAVFPRNARIDKTFQTVVPIFFLNKTLGLRIFALEGHYGSGFFDNTPTLAVVWVGSILSIIITLFIFFLQKHQKYLEKEVERTSEKVKNDELLAREMTEVLPIVAYQSLWDEDFTPVFMSKYVESITGYPVSDYMNGKVHLSNSIHPDDLETLVKDINKGIRINGSFAIQYRLIDKNKKIVWVDSRGYVGGYDKYGNPEFINGFLYDITERKTILERLQQMQNNLADANLELKKFTEKSERIAVEAEQANKEKTEFLTKLSHFIRTPMNAIIGACELLRDSKQAEEQKGISEEIIVNSNKLIEILNGILGKSNLELATIDVKSKKKPQTIEASKVQPVHETKKKLLVVEDNKTNQKVVLAMLKKLGYTADIANDGAEALNILAYKYYDLIFMDCQMPIIDGLEATRRIRKGEGVVDPKVTIVALTANAMASDKAKCFEVGMNDFLSKPVTPKDIAGILEKWL